MKSVALVKVGAKPGAFCEPIPASLLKSAKRKAELLGFNDSESALSLSRRMLEAVDAAQIHCEKPRYNLKMDEELHEAHFIEAIVEGQVCTQGSQKIMVSIEGKGSRVLPICKGNIVIERDSMNYSLDVKLNAGLEADRTAKLISECIGKRMMLGVSEKGEVNTFALAGGWCWDEI